MTTIGKFIRQLTAKFTAPDDTELEIQLTSSPDETNKITKADFLKELTAILNTHTHNHADIANKTTDDHHPQLHNHTGADGSGSVNHDDLFGTTEDNHHNKLHAHDGADGSGIVEAINVTYDGSVSDLDAVETQTAIDVIAADINGHQTSANPHGKMTWRNEWVAGEYLEFDTVYDDGWAMVANKTTSDRPAPQNVGDKVEQYRGDSPIIEISAKSVVSGTKVLSGVNAYTVSSYSVYTVLGNAYRVFSIAYDTGAQNELVSFTAKSTGWQTFPINPVIIPSGSAFSVVQSVREAAASETSFTGNWNYTTPKKTGSPSNGNIIHANKAESEFRINKTDNTSTDFGAQLLALVPGDIIDGIGMRWSIQSITDAGAYVTLFVSPATQGSPDGDADFTFETTAVVPITVVADVDYWLNNPSPDATVTGIYSIDEADTVETNSAYGINLTVQLLSVSPDWDLLAPQSGANASLDDGVVTFNQIYPVGSIYISTSATNPATHFGGTWAAYGTGRMLVGIDTADTDFDAVNLTGGEKAHQLTESEMPSHNHDQNAHSHITNGIGTPNEDFSGLSGGGKGGWSVANGSANNDIYHPVEHESTATNLPTGGDAAHNNMPPYIVTYMWNRTS